MPITFACPCGKQLAVGDEFAGRPVRCPACDSVLDAPPAPEQPPRARRIPEPDDRPTSRRSRWGDREDEPEDDIEEARPPSRWQDEDPELLARRRRRAADEEDTRREQRRKQARGEVIGGGVALAIGMLWLALVAVAGKVDFEDVLYIAMLLVGGLVGLAIGVSKLSREE